MKKYTAIIILICCVFIIGVGLPMVLKHFFPVDIDLDKKKQHEEKIEALTHEFESEKKAFELLEKKRDSLESKLKEQQGSTVIIKKEYGKMRDAVTRLPDDSAILFIANRLSKKGAR